MKNKATITYEDALRIALPYFCAFYDLSDEVKATKDRHSYEWLQWKNEELTRLANGCCCATEMVCDLFGASNEKVHMDLFALRDKEA